MRTGPRSLLFALALASAACDLVADPGGPTPDDFALESAAPAASPEDETENERAQLQALGGTATKNAASLEGWSARAGETGEASPDAP